MIVHCRTGSLEKRVASLFCFLEVHCRTGSLERLPKILMQACEVHCRTGSLEIALINKQNQIYRSLPHRQLRKQTRESGNENTSSLPHRQLRKNIYA